MSTMRSWSGVKEAVSLLTSKYSQLKKLHHEIKNSNLV